MQVWRQGRGIGTFQQGQDKLIRRWLYIINEWLLRDSGHCKRPNLCTTLRIYVLFLSICLSLSQPPTVFHYAAHFGSDPLELNDISVSTSYRDYRL